MTRKIFLIYVAWVLLIPGMFIGCIGGSSQQSVYYVFNPAQESSDSPSPLKGKALGVGPVKLPGFLKRPQIVVRHNPNILDINEFHRWGNSLEEQVTIVLVENLSVLLNTPNVTAYPWDRTFSPAYQLFIDLRQFDGEINKSAILEAVWWFVEINDNKRLITKRSSIVVPTEGGSYKNYVIALNTSLDKLCREITEEIIGILP